MLLAPLEIHAFGLPSHATTQTAPAAKNSYVCPDKHFLSKSKVKSLDSLLAKRVAIRSQINDLTLHLTLRELFVAMKQGFTRAGIALKKNGICLVGSSAASLISSDPHLRHEVNDVDITFHLMYSENFWEILRIQETVLAMLLKQKIRKHITAHECYNMFFHESLYVDNDREKWSLISIGSDSLSVDMKVVYKCSRPYAFSVDSFEIILDDVLEYTHHTSGRASHSLGEARGSDSHSPGESDCLGGARDSDSHSHSLGGDGECQSSKIEVRSNYGDYREAYQHLKFKKLRTCNPGDIHHGFFRYCLEIARGNRPDNFLYDLIFTANFYEEFRGMGAEDFGKILSKFVNKHKKHWFCILSTMHYLLSIYAPPKEEVTVFLPVIGQLMFTPKISAGNGF